MNKIEDLIGYMRKDRNIMIGELTASGIKKELSAISKEKIRIQGRSLVTGKKKVVHVRLVDFLKN